MFMRVWVRSGGQGCDLRLNIGGRSHWDGFRVEGADYGLNCRP